jgi:UDP-N-acetylglucosamine--N-acetylmuramyl-(pentapeptide) pyrophosphoryl-undecaprenol N-acetylglucosamine transferase
MKYILSGGGTGGHIYPAIAIANELKRRDPACEILFVGAQDKMEMEKVPANGYKIEGLWISGLQRKLTLSNFLFPFKVLASKFKAKKILVAFQPDVVIGTGGFASGSIVNEAVGKGIKTLIQEQNSYAGLTNKILGRKVNTVCVAYDGMEKFFPKNKIVLTGNPIRKDIINIYGKKKQAYKLFDIDDEKKTLLILGGSLGSGTINKSIAMGIEKLKAANINVFWQTGSYYFETYKNYNSENIKVSPFIKEMDIAYAVADIVISRAGALSISEMACANKASILVPSPNVAEDHQTKNAMALVNKNAALIITDVNAPVKLVDEALLLMKDENKINALKKNISDYARMDSTEKIVDEIIKLTIPR